MSLRGTRLPLAFLFAMLLPVVSAAQDRPVQPPVVSAAANGFTIESANGDFQLRLGGLVQADGRFALADDRARAVDSFIMRRARPTFRGRLARRFEFFLNPDFAGGTLVLQDAYLDTVFSPAFRVRIGKGKTPFGLERLQSVAYTLFYERALPSALAPNRDIGVQVAGDLAGGMVTYQGGVLNGVTDGGSADVDASDSKDVAGRLLVRPFQRRPAADPIRGVAIGFAMTAGKQSGAAALPTLRTASLQQTIFAYTGAVADGTRVRYSPHAFYVFKSFAGLFEYVHTEMPVASATARSDVAHQAWQIAGSFLITGEAATDGSTSVRPRENFDFGNGHWGAFQIVARYHRLEVDEAGRRFAAADSALTAEGWTAGVNWYLTPNIRYLVNVERTVFDGNANSARPAENALVFRSQLAF